GYEFSPVSIEVTASGSDVTGQDFEAVEIIAITTVAGTGEAGYSGDNDQAAGAILNSPFDVFVDSTDNLIFSDFSNHRVRRVDGQTGIITTVAGTGRTSFSGDGGQGTEANLDWPAGVLMDSAGNLFIADAKHHRIRRMDAQTGVITTVAGTGKAGFSGDGSQATEAKLNSPFGIFMDSGGNLFVADRYNHRIRRIDGQTGIITTFAGTGVGGFSGDSGLATEANLTWPFDIFVDAEGDLFLTDYGNHRVRWVDGQTGIINTIAGTGDAGFSGDGEEAMQAMLNHPAGIFVDSEGAMFFADQDNDRVRRVDGQTGIITTVVGGGNEGLGDGGRATRAKLNYPTGIFVDSVGNLFIADTRHNRIRCVKGVAAPTILENIPPDEDITPTAIVSVETEQTVNQGDLFSAEINVENVTGLAGFRLDVAFNPAVLEVVSIEEGEFLSGDGGTFWLEPHIDNTTGTITGITCARMGEGSADGSGVIVSVGFKAVGIGESLIEPRNVELSNSDGELMPVQLSGATVTVSDIEPYPAWDINKDGVVGISDLVLVGQHIGQDISTPLDPNPDVNGDGKVNILDLILVGGHFDENQSPAAPSRDIWIEAQHLPILIKMYNFMADNPRSDPDFLITKSLLYRLIFSVTISKTEVFQNYPNPFNPDTWIPYQLAEDVDVVIRIYDATGRLVRALNLGHKPGGFYTTKEESAYWDGRNEAGEQVASGIYFYSITAGDFSAMRKMVVKK
ncbi:MAG: T9SS type A sorting domain-containing protein, partial [Deltaproteobacteria bacterium]|nr:T9SS type A sorting domain-containing protein [Deltaproteobacteria bacterium]